TSLSLLKNHKPVTKKLSLSLRKKEHLLLLGPNGIGKTTLLESIVNGTATGVMVTEGVTIGYFRQDFRTLNFNQSTYESLSDISKNISEEEMRSVAAGFLLNTQILKTKIGDLSEGQKGLLSFARLVLQKPGLLILDEPTNHMNFRHIPVIAEALDTYEGAMILVSHVPEFVKQIRIDQTLDLESLS
ncbi:MAG: ATP-binding cassette domain-containing protein, partial [Patescibacteria group bacterium]